MPFVRSRFDFTAVIAGCALLGCSGGGSADDDVAPSGNASVAGQSGSSSAGTAPGGRGGNANDGASAGLEESGGTAGTATAGSGASGAAGASEGGAAGSGSETPPPQGCPDPAVLNPWIAENFSGVPVLSGDFDTRQKVELPSLIQDATGTNAKYAFDLYDEQEPLDPRVALVNVQVKDLASSDIYGAAVQTSHAPGAELFISNVFVEPNWPTWMSYDDTNYDGLVLDGSSRIYAENLTIQHWNADSAIDIKAEQAQFVCLSTVGDGNRTLRFWKTGPHYLVRSSVNNMAGDVMWFADCDNTTVYVYESTFNGAGEVPIDRVACDSGTAPQFVYLDSDPIAAGELHPMFSR